MAPNVVLSQIGGSFAHTSLQVSPSVDNTITSESEKQGTHPFYDNASIDKIATLKSTFGKEAAIIREVSDEEPTPLVTSGIGRVRSSAKEEDDTDIMTDFDIKEEEQLRA